MTIILIMKTSNPKEIILSNPRRAEVIILSGGAAKIGAYTGVCGAIHDHLQSRKNIKAYIGTSAGALASAVLACGIHPEAFRNRIFSTNFSDILGIGNNVVSSFFSVPAQSDGMMLYIELHRWICESIAEGLKTVQRELIQNPEDINSFAALERKIQSTWSIQPITFQDLDLLHRYFPEQFKELVIIATQENNGQTKRFDARHTPHVEIAKAAHASAAIPIALKSVIIDGIAYIDGGVKDNTPTGYYESESDENRLIFAFSDSEGLLSQALHSTQAKRSGHTLDANAFLDNLGYKRTYDINKNFELTYQKIRNDYALQTISLETWNLSSSDFKGANQIKRELEMMGYLDTQDFLFAHELHQTESCAHASDTRLSIIAQFKYVYSLIPKERKSIQDKVLSQFQEYEKGKLTSLSLYHWIRQKASENLNSIYTFVLTRALEMHRALISLERLQEECMQWNLPKKQAKEGLKQKPTMQQSSLTQTIYSLEIDAARSHHHLSKEMQSIRSCAQKIADIPQAFRPHIQLFFQQILDLDELYEQLHIKYENKHQKEVAKEQKNRSFMANIAHQFCPDFDNTVPVNSQRPDFLLLKDMQQAMIHAYKLCLIPDASGTGQTWTKIDYQKNIEDFHRLVPKLHGHGSKYLQYFGVALFIVGLTATLLLSISMFMPIPFIFELPYIYYGLGLSAVTAISGAALFIQEERKGLSKACEDLIKASSKWISAQCETPSFRA
jgi:predicted acylesterase/phospholipase RssA